MQKHIMLDNLCLLINIVTFYDFYQQGGWETDETAEEAACREAYEEAGVRGDLKVLFLTLNLFLFCYISVK